MQSNHQSHDLAEIENISLTALRILVIFDMLLKAPCDDKEINKQLKEEIKDSRELSKDTICIYLNTLRLLGCVISRPTRNNSYQYSLMAHPFKLSVSKEEVKTLIELRKYVSTQCDWKITVEVDNLFNTLIKQLSPTAKKLFSQAKKTFMSREVTSENFLQDIKQLEKYCNQNKEITIIYNSPESGEKNITLIAEKITMEKGAFYLWGYNEELESTMYLRMDRILAVKSVSTQNNNAVDKKSITVRYKLKNRNCYSSYISEDDKIISTTENEITLESDVTNKFRFCQKILSYGSDCTILSPNEIKEELLTKLENILNTYKDAT